MSSHRHAIDLVAVYSISTHDILQQPLLNSHQGFIHTKITPILLHDQKNPTVKLPERLDSFCFPTGVRIYVSENPLLNLDLHQHSFVLTVASGREMYGSCAIKYCPVDSLVNSEKKEEALFYYIPVSVCVLSKYPFYDTFHKYLKDFSHRHSSLFETSDSELQKVKLELLFETLMLADYPSKYLNSDSTDIWQEDIEPEVDMNILFRKLHLQTIISLFNAILCETSIVFLTNDLSILVPVMETLKYLISPLKWPFGFLPVLPSEFQVFLDNPQPVLAGMSKDLFKEGESLLNDTIIVDVDTDHIKFPYGYKSSPFPRRLINKLVASISERNKNPKYQNTPPIYEFLCSMASLLGGFESYFIDHGMTVQQLRQRSLRRLFDHDKFVENSPPFYASFLEILVHSQAFQIFIEDRYASITSTEKCLDKFQKVLSKRVWKRNCALRKIQFQMLFSPLINFILSLFIEKLSNCSKSGFIWMSKSSRWSSWEYCEIIIESKSIYCVSRNFFSCSSRQCSCDSPQKLICRLDDDLILRLLDPHSYCKSMVNPYGFHIISKANSKRKVNIMFCVDSEEDLKLWVDCIYSKLVYKQTQVVQ